MIEVKKQITVYHFDYDAKDENGEMTKYRKNILACNQDDADKCLKEYLGFDIELNGAGFSQRVDLATDEVIRILRSDK